MPSTAALTLEDRISDPMMPELDPSLLDFQPMNIDFNSKKDDPLDWNSQLPSDPTSIEIGRHAPTRDPRSEFDEEDMNIDLGLDLGLDDGPSLELGLKAPPPKDLDDGLTNDEKKLHDDFIVEDRERSVSRVPSLIADVGGRDPEDDQMMLDNDDGFQIHMDDEHDLPSAPSDSRLQRDSQSPLSSLRSSMAREFEVTHLNAEDIEPSIRQATQKAKKRKVIQADSDTMLSSNQIKQQQADRSAILKPTSFLSRDPVLLNLMNMQKSGGFVSSIMGEGRTNGWAPELRGILSVDTVRKSGELKRKRDSGVADVSENEGQSGNDRMPQLEIPDETFGAVDESADGPFDATVGDRSEVYLPADDGFLPENEDAGVGGRQDDEDVDDVRDQFDETTAPLLHPSEQGAVSQTTKHAVHLLRDRFGSWAGGSPAQQKKSQILFQDLLPEAKTSKADATKMFFEVLVLATKDAVKVEQSDKEVGGSIRVRAKRSLWGAWAAREAGGEIAEQEDPGPVAAPS